MNVSAYAGAERRQAPRIRVEALTYIGFESNNGGIVLNVSGGGLSFRAIAPTCVVETVDFWFSTAGCRMDAQGEVVWIDETQKTGGLRFKALSPAARDQVRQWLSSPASALNGVGEPGKALSRSSPANLEQADKEALSLPTRLEEPLHKPHLPLGGFSRGLISGFLMASFAGAVILLLTNRRQFGESLIKIGERLASRQTTPQAPLPIPFMPVEGPGASSAPRNIVNRPPLKTGLPPPAEIPSEISPVMSLPFTNTARGPSLLPAEPAAGRRPETANDSGPSETAPEAEPENSSSNALADPPNGGLLSAPKYLEVGEFRQQIAADKSEKDLEGLGFHASVNRRGHLWASSYHVLVGPYNNDEDVERARSDLESHGFRIRSRGRRSRRFTLPSMTLAGTDTVLKDCLISWDPNSSAATLLFLKGGNVISKAQGKWVKKGVTYKLDAVLSQSSDRGPETLLEIQCHGMNRALVLDLSKPIRYFIPPLRLDI